MHKTGSTESDTIHVYKAWESRRSVRERGVAMLLVLITVAIATVLSMSFLSSQATSLGVAQNIQGHAQARSVAESALVVAIDYVQTDTDWRTDKSEGQWVSNASFNGGTFDLYAYDGLDTDGDGVVDDTDSDLADDASDPVTLKVVADVDGVSHTVFAVVTTGDGGAPLEVLMVVGNSGSLTAQDDLRVDLMEGWGMNVTLLSDEASQSAYNTAADLVEVVYVAESSSSSTVGTKATAMSIGVVTDEPYIYDDLEVSSTNGSSFSDDQLDIVDNSHYITSTIESGDMNNLEYTSSTQTMYYVNGTLGTGVTVLATRDTSSTPTIVAVDAGGVLADNSAAAGRRVLLPTAGGFDMDSLTSAGETILERSLRWAGAEVSMSLPLARWALEEGSGATASDSMSLSNGTYRNSPTLGQPGINGLATHFDGSNDYIEIPHDDALLLDNGSISFWFNADNTSGHQAMFSKDSNGYDTGGRCHIYLDGSTLKVRFQSTGTSYTLQSSSGISSGSWHHVTFTFGSGGMALYLDDALVDTDSYTGGMGTTSGGVGNYEPLAIGAGTWSSGNLTISSTDYYYDGLIDDVRVYGSVIGAAQVSQIYSGSESDGTTGPQLIALYEFEEVVVTPDLVGQWKLDDHVTISGLDVMLVVDDASSLSGQDQAKKDLLESWGCDVDVFTDDSSQAEYQTAFLNADAAYLTLSATSSNVTTKMADTYVGVVYELSYMSDYFKIATGGGFNNNDEIDIIDNSHYITSPYSIGLLTLLDSNEQLHYNTGTIAPGADVLAERIGSSVKAMIAVDVGAELNGGDAAPGRRVKLPWGKSNFDFTELNTDGQDLLMRSIMWAALAKTIDSTSTSHGSYINAPTLGQAGMGDGGLAVQFDGVDDYVAISHNDAYLLDNGSISFWFKADSLSGIQGLVTKDSNGFDTGGHIRVYTEGSILKARIQSTGTSYYVQSSGISTGTWYHVTVSWGAGGFKLSRDGTERDTDSYTGGLGTTSGGVGNYEPIVFGADTWMSGDLDTSGLVDYFDGTIDEVRIYDQSLNESQVGEVYAGGAPSSGVAMTVYDTSEYGAALDLDIEDTGNVSWIPGGGLTIDSATRISSASAATKLYTALTATDEMSVAILFTPENITQNGPARIVSYSDGSSSRNFTFGQDADEYITRLRTSSTTSNGTPSADSGSTLTAGTQVYVIVSYDGENITMYREGGSAVTLARTGTLNWDSSFDLILGNESVDGYDWLGSLHRVSIYDRAFNQTQADNVFNGNDPGDDTSSGTVNSVDWVEY